MFFGGKPLWHVSIALWSILTGRPKTVSSWTQADHDRADRLARNALAGVGIDDQMRAEHGHIALQIRKATTTAEADAVFRTPRGRLIAARHAAG